jgi:hypothetical protein
MPLLKIIFLAVDIIVSLCYDIATVVAAYKIAETMVFVKKNP